MKIAPVAKVKARFSAYLRRCEEGPVIITKNGRPVAVLIAALEDEDLERLILAYTPKFRRIIEFARDNIQQTGGISHEDFWQSIETDNVPANDH